MERSLAVLFDDIDSFANSDGPPDFSTSCLRVSNFSIKRSIGKEGFVCSILTKAISMAILG